MSEETPASHTPSAPITTEPSTTENTPATSKKGESKAPKASKAAKTKSAKGDQAKEKIAPAAEVNNVTAAELLGDTAEKIKITKIKGSKNVPIGIAYVLATFNNTIVTLTDLNGNVLAWSSAGKCGFRGSKKSTAYVAQVVAQDACKKAMAHGLREVQVRVKGPGTGRESAVRAIQAIGIEISNIIDTTPIPHNGCRSRKPRRV
jgi:small subunit ribosomal protein S11